MPGRGPAPKETRRRRNAPQRGEYKSSPTQGWQHGPIPSAPDGLLAASRDAWTLWFTSWVAAHWTPADVPTLRQVIALFDVVERGQAKAAERSELRQLMDNYGITPRGQQDRRWVAPKAEEPKVTPTTEDPEDPYRHLRVVS